MEHERPWLLTARPPDSALGSPDSSSSRITITSCGGAPFGPGKVRPMALGRVVLDLLL
jgi:hypothetical protein